MNLSIKDVKEIISKPNVALKLVRDDEIITLTGTETVRPAKGGELKEDSSGNYIIDEKQQEPAGINLANETFVGLLSIEEIFFDE